MWLLFAFSSALFAGLTSILAKIGIKNIDSNVATAIRTIIILIFAWIMVFITKGYTSEITIKSIIFLILSGISTGLSWIFYFKSLQIGNVNKVVPIDKSSTVLTMILAFKFLKETITIIKVFGIIFIGIGTYLMITKKDDEEKEVKGKLWFYYAIFSAFFAALTSILGKIGVTGIDSNYATAIRTVVVLIMAWLVVFMSKKQSELKNIKFRTFLFLCLSGITTGLSWLSYYKALQYASVSVVAPIDKLSIVITIAFSYFVFKEKLSKKSFIGILGIILGTFTMLI